jgi:hypothetical protein
VTDYTSRSEWTCWIENERFFKSAEDVAGRCRYTDRCALNFRNTGTNHYAEEHESRKNAWSTPRKYGYNTKGHFWFHNTPTNVARLEALAVKEDGVSIKLDNLLTATDEQRLAWLKKAGDKLGDKTIAITRHYVKPNKKFVMRRRLMVCVMGHFVSEPTIKTTMSEEGWPKHEAHVTISYKPDDAHKTWVYDYHRAAAREIDAAGVAETNADIRQSGVADECFKWFAMDVDETWWEKTPHFISASAIKRHDEIRLYRSNTHAPFTHDFVKEVTLRPIFEFGWKQLKEMRAPFKEALAMAVFKPERVERMIAAHGDDWLERV